MAASNQIECHPVVGCISNKISPGVMAQCLTSPTSRPTATSKGVSAIIPAILDHMISAYKRHQSRVALGKLNEDQLHDIGLTRDADGHLSRKFD
jgi:uncharacterized protein YjiS (DUF1127 family)